jgi:hypothetical protein
VRLQRGSPDPNWPVRRNFVLLSLLTFAPLVVRWIPRDPDPQLWAWFVFIGISLLPHLVYLLAVRSRIGSIIVGLALLVATAASVLWLLSIEIDDGLEALWVPVATWGVGFPALALHGVVSVVQGVKESTSGARVD